MAGETASGVHKSMTATRPIVLRWTALLTRFHH